MDAGTRLYVRQRAEDRCEYWGLRQEHRIRLNKLSRVSTVVATVTGAVEVLFHPRRDRWAEPFQYLGVTVTQTRDKFKNMDKGRNLTIHLPDQLIRQLRLCAAMRNQSMTTVVKEAIERTLVEDSVRESSASRLIRRLQNAPDRGIGGKVSWTRDQIHDR